MKTLYRVVRFNYSDLSVTHDKTFCSYRAAQRYIDKLYKECGCCSEFGISLFEGKIVK